MFDSAHQASVPIAVHLDHATDPEHIELALSLAEQGIAFDSIMVDASHAEVCLFSSSSSNLSVSDIPPLDRRGEHRRSPAPRRACKEVRRRGRGRAWSSRRRRSWPEGDLRREAH